MIGIYGKHPGFGDFVAAGFCDATVTALTGWLDAVLPVMRNELGANWEAVFDTASEIRFWIGAGVIGTPLCGTLRSSRDKVGRRFPLILGQEGSGQLPPMLDTDQASYVAMSEHLDRIGDRTGAGAAVLLDGFDGPEPDGSLPDGDQIWAVRPGGTAQDLLASASTADHLRLASGRSYWWAENAPGRAAILHACNGLPDAPALSWLAMGVAAEDQDQQMSEASHGQ